MNKLIAYNVYQNESVELYKLGEELAESGDDRLEKLIQKICARNHNEQLQAEALQREFFVSENNGELILETQCGEFGETVTFNFDKDFIDKYGIGTVIKGLKSQVEVWRLEGVITDEDIIKELNDKISIIEKGEK